MTTSSQAPYPRQLVPDDFIVPEAPKTKRFKLRMLTVNDVVRDFDAVTTSEEHLLAVFGGDWPAGLTLEQNLIDLGWHQKEFQRRRSFAYTVVAPDESRVLGCMYIYPTWKQGYDAEVYFWARQSELENGLETELESVIRKWLIEKWPFRNAAYPGRDMTLAEWEDLEESVF